MGVAVKKPVYYMFVKIRDPALLHTPSHRNQHCLREKAFDPMHRRRVSTSPPTMATLSSSRRDCSPPPPIQGTAKLGSLHGHQMNN